MGSLDEDQFAHTIRSNNALILNQSFQETPRPETFKDSKTPIKPSEKGIEMGVTPGLPISDPQSSIDRVKPD
jgi:hypothetical protein